MRSKVVKEFKEIKGMKIEELFIGAWVQELSPTVKKLTPPMRVVGLFKGTKPENDMAYLEMDGSEGDPWECKVKDLVLVDGKGEKGFKGEREDDSCKNDRKDGKLRWELLPLDLIEKVVEVYTFGAEKYSPNSWQGLEDGYERYKAAFLRHVVAFEKGEKKDPESGLSHLAHAAWNGLAMLWFGGEERR